jgi:flagellar biosynthesis/type III secretory pathway M-ring protein FliF/YscJ
MNRVQSTREELLPSTKDGATGVLVRERSEAEGEGGSSGALPPLPGSSALVASPATSGRHEREYQVGRDVKQTVSVPGAVRRIAIAAVVNDTLDASQVAHLKEVLAATVGYDASRGDTIAVYPFKQVAPLGQDATDNQPQAAASEQPSVLASPASGGRGDVRVTTTHALRWLAALPAWLIAAVAAAAALIAVFFWLVYSARKSQPVGEERPLDEAQRAALLSDMERWLAAAPSQGTLR